MYPQSSWAKRQRKTGHGEGHFILMSLKNGPLTKESLDKVYMRFGSILGVSLPVEGTKKYTKWQNEVQNGIKQLTDKALITINKEGAYCLTEQGYKEAELLDNQFSKIAKPISNLFLSAEKTAKLSVLINLVLAILKLSVGFVINSVALIADGFDNTLDVISAFVVFLGIKFKRDLLPAIFLITMMFFTAGWIGYESVTRFINPESIDVGYLIIIIVVISGVVSYLMSLLQNMVGKNSHSLPLISQSIDSRNHAIIAVAVLIGIVFASFDVFIVDSIVGLVVAIMIFKSSVDLTGETIHIIREGKIDTSRFTRIEERMFEKRRKEYFKSWILYCLKEKKTKKEIIQAYNQTFPIENLPLIYHLGFIKGFDFRKNFDVIIEELIENRMVTLKGMKYYLTEVGNRELKRKLQYQRYL